MYLKNGRPAIFKSVELNFELYVDTVKSCNKYHLTNLERDGINIW